ncbi:MAG: 1-acyl-sn-glycerol-3-phosphate acyltransferase [Ruminococcaceae bacterium]|nr:1-acyl-sn-glycerol-3-phosphate acyltransferase [Oscillospiraceae bacterium]
MLLGTFAALSLIVGALVCLASGAFLNLSWLWLLPLTAVGSLLMLILLTFGFLMILCKRVDQDVPQEEDDRLYRVVTDLIIESVLPVLRIHVKKSGLEKMPKDGRFLLVCNHTDNSDPIILLYCLAKYQLAFISKRENRDMFVIGPMMHKLQCQLINRENDREALKTILTCIRILKEDKASVAVFPEGGIDDDLLLHRFRPGVFKIAQKANVPIVVCTLKNTKVVVKNLMKWKRSDVEMKVLEVIPAEELKGITTVDIADRCYRLMAEDLGPDLVAD